MVNEELRNRILAGSCDCAEVAARIAGVGLFDQVGVLMASDTGRIGNSCLNLRRSEPAFSAEGATEENLVRRTTMSTIVLSTQTADYQWNEVSREQRDRLRRLQREAVEIIGGPEDHNAMLELISKYSNLRYDTTNFLFRAMEVGRNAQDIQQVLEKRGITLERAGIHESLRFRGCFPRGKFGPKSMERCLSIY